MNKRGAVMIGDRKHDIIGAQNNGMDSIAVAYGYGSDEELTAIHPMYNLKSVQELQEFFEGDELKKTEGQGPPSLVSVLILHKNSLIPKPQPPQLRFCAL